MKSKIQSKKLAEAEPPQAKTFLVRMDVSMHERLRQLSFDTREPITSIVLRGIELALKAAKH